jgi:multiple sugar transport system substrate-binding protein
MLSFLKTATTAATTLALGATLATAAFADPYDPYKGETLVVNFPAHPHYDAVMKVLPEFTKETGIAVEVD